MLNWSCLPDTFKREVIRKLDFLSRCSLRECSKSEKSLIDSSPILLEYIRIKKDDQTFGKIEFLVSEKHRNFKKHTENSENVIRDFFRIIGHPKTTLDEIIIDFPYTNPFNTGFFQILSRELKLSNLKIKTAHFFWSCHVDNNYSVLELFKKLDPNYLKRIYLDTCPQREIMMEVVKSEQWKKLKEFTVSVYQTFYTQLTVSINQLLNFDNLQICEKKMSSDEVLIVIQNFLSKPRPLGSFFTLGSGIAFDTLGILDQLGESCYFHENENCRVYPIFHSPYILLVRVEDQLITGVIRRLDQLLDDEEKPRFLNWSDHIQRLGEGVPY